MSIIELDRYHHRVKCLRSVSGDILTASMWNSLIEAVAYLIDYPLLLRKCDWCGGSTYDDIVGNCAACGGPRENYGPSPEP